LEAVNIYAVGIYGGLPANGAAAIGNDPMPYPVKAKAIQLTYPSGIDVSHNHVVWFNVHAGPG
jgi:hypothetical protein